MGKRYVYNWTDMMVGTGIDKIVHHDMELCRARIFNAWIEYWESNILRTLDQDNDQRILQKYKNIRFLDDEENQTYIIVAEKFEFKGPTRRNKQYCLVRYSLNWRGEENVDLLVSIEINDDFMVRVKGVEQDPALGVKTVHP